MGCGSRAGKMEMHSAGKPQVEQEYCVGCGKCQRICAHDAPVITMVRPLLTITSVLVVADV